MNCCKYSEIEPGQEKLVSNLVREVFGEFIAPGYSEEGIETFRQLSQADEIKKAVESGRFLIICCWDSENLVGIISMRDNRHINFLFVKKQYHRRGIAKELYKRALMKCEEINPGISEITVNSSPYAVDIYRRLGFTAVGEQTTRDGITYTPMKMPLDCFRR